MTITFDNEAVHVLYEDDQAILKTTGIELDDEDPGEPFPGEEESNYSNEAEIDPEDTIPKQDQGNYDEPESLQEIYEQFEVEDDPDSIFDRIVVHFFNKGKLIPKVKYDGDDDQSTTMEIVFLY